MSPTPIATTGMPPIEWPTVTIGGSNSQGNPTSRTYVVKFSQMAEYLISKWGYDLADLYSIIRPDNKDPRRFALTIQLFAAMVGHEFISSVPPQTPLTPEQWMMILPNVETSDALSQIGKAVALALVKHLSERMKTTAPAPTVAAQPTTNVQ